MSKLGKVTGFKRYLHLASCFGASIVIIGALFKIQHWPGANAALIAGLGTEAVLFCLFGIDIPHEEVDWTLAYPELSGMAHEEHEEPESNLPITAQLDNLLADAKIGPDLIKSLGTGMKSLGESVNKMSDITNASVATNEYVDSVKNATKNVSNLSDTYSKATQSFEGIAESNQAGANILSVSYNKAAQSFEGIAESNQAGANILSESYNKAAQSTEAGASGISESLSKVSKNLSALNATYELQLQDSKSQLDTTSKFYDGLNELMKNLHDSLDDTKKYRQEMATLSNNLTSLNTVYGNMLSAMNFKS
jgi:methyl-accepting chemotaxis protein